MLMLLIESGINNYMKIATLLSRSFYLAVIISMIISLVSIIKLIFIFILKTIFISITII